MGRSLRLANRRRVQGQGLRPSGQAGEPDTAAQSRDMRHDPFRPIPLPGVGETGSATAARLAEPA